MNPYVQLVAVAYFCAALAEIGIAIKESDNQGAPFFFVTIFNVLSGFGYFLISHN